MTYVPSNKTCPGSLVWATDVDGTEAICPFCQARLALEPGDRSGTMPAHDADDDRLPIPAADLEDFIAEAVDDLEVRADDREVRRQVLLRLIAMRDASRPCVDPDHGIGDHPCDEVLGKERAALLREDSFERAREFDRTHPGYWEYREDQP